MLLELRVRDLGVIDDQTLLLGPGLTALTGETGAGKTLIVEALGLLVGERSDALLVRPGAEEAVVEGRFGVPPGERILARAVAATGRSRAYLDGRMASAAALAEVGATLLDLHGQHASQSLLAPPTQRSALEAAGGVDRGRVDETRRRLRLLTAKEAELGGDGRARAHEVDLLRFQLAELDAAGIEDPGEDDALREDEERLGDAVALRAALAAAHEALAGEDGAVDRVGAAVAAVSGSRSLGALVDRLRAVAAEVADGADEVRLLGEAIEEDPERLARVGARRHALRELRRKFGDTLAEVIAYREQARRRLDDLEAHDATATALAAERAGLEAQLVAAEAELAAARRAAAGPFAHAVLDRLQQLALPRARFEVRVGGRAGDDVAWLLGANPGEPALPLAKVASGGELARTMLAVRLVLGQAASPDGDGSDRTLVFDEVDAGVGGEAAAAVGAALAALADHHQVIVVTHLAQVAAFADRHLVVTKGVEAAAAGERTVARVHGVDGEERVAELSRMLSGRPGSATARSHAAELLSEARPVRSRRGRGR
ncbi:MAG: DNA repair protein RecN [Acidimicrobiales bacterium]